MNSTKIHGLPSVDSNLDKNSSSVEKVLPCNNSIMEDAPNDDLNFFSFGLCHVCKMSNKSLLQTCSACKSIFYCSKEHQRKDWTKHKDLCKAIAKVNTILPCPPNCSGKEFNQLRYSRGLLWSCELGRPLKLYEQQMWMFPKVCSICYSVNVPLSCQKCLSVAYCSQTHKDQDEELHETLCGVQELSLQLLKYVYQGNETLYKDPNLKFDIDVLPGNTDDFMKLLGIYSPNTSADYLNYVLIAEYFCSAPIIIHGLNEIKLLNGRTSIREEIVIHIIGFDAVEEKLRWEVITEFIGHWITNLKSLKLFCIGPEVLEESINKNLANETCDICSKKSFTATITTLKTLYQEAVDYIETADMVIAFNSGLSEFKGGLQDTWKGSLPHLIEKSPLLLTAYTSSEIQDDLARFTQSIKYILEPQKNPYCGLIPVRNWAQITEPVFYQNGYITIIVQDYK